jgi:hypothetical protein
VARARELVRDADAARVVRLLLEKLATVGGIDARVYESTCSQVLSDGNSDIARSAAWAASLIDEPWVVPGLRAGAYRGIRSSGSDYVESPKPANGCIYSLGVIASAVIAALQDLRRTTRHNGFRKQISASLASAAQRSGLTPSQLSHRTGKIPDRRPGTRHGPTPGIVSQEVTGTGSEPAAEQAVLWPWSSGDGRVRVRSSARTGSLLAGVTRPWCGVWGPRACGWGRTVAGPDWLDGR